MKIKIIDDVEIYVPDSIKRMTTYILLEQEDWFEDEIKFLRKTVLPGMQVIDVGANYGLYSLMFAGKVAPKGMVWSFEPAAATVEYLSRSIKSNGFKNIKLVKAALSDHCGQANLWIFPDAEINTLALNTSASRFETVELLTLDACADEYGWNNIDIIKLDAEGEEQKIVSAGHRFLTDNSPLIMFELRHGKHLNHSLIGEFDSLGYTSYRLLPGLQGLLSIEKNQQHDNYLLNLFCCKQDRAESLAERGILIRSQQPVVDKKNVAHMHWRKSIAGKAYSKKLQQDWLKWIHKNPVVGWKAYEQALCFYGLTNEGNLCLSEKYTCLVKSRRFLDQALESKTNIPRLLTAARICWELGERMSAISILNKLLQMINPDTELSIREPFLPVSRRYDTIGLESRKQLTEWCLSSVIEQYEKLLTFSSFYIRGTGEMQASLNRLMYLCNHAFCSAEMERRLQLIRLVNGLQGAIQSSELLSTDAGDNRNATIWRNGDLIV